MSNILYENEKVIICSEVVKERTYAVLRNKEDNKVIETYSAVYPETINNDNLIVRSKIPPYLSGIIDLKLIGTGHNIYVVPLSYFKVIYVKDIGYILVYSPNDCVLVNKHFKQIPPGRCEKIIVEDKVIIGKRFDGEVKVPIV